jgi:hypothetical protein
MYAVYIYCRYTHIIALYHWHSTTGMTDVKTVSTWLWFKLKDSQQKTVIQTDVLYVAYYKSICRRAQIGQIRMNPNGPVILSCRWHVTFVVCLTQLSVNQALQHRKMGWCCRVNSISGRRRRLCSNWRCCPVVDRVLLSKNRKSAAGLEDVPCLTFIWQCIMVNYYNKTNQMH